MIEVGVEYFNRDFWEFFLLHDGIVKNGQIGWIVGILNNVFFKKKKLDWYDDVGVYNKLFGIGYGYELWEKKYRS